MRSFGMPWRLGFAALLACMTGGAFIVSTATAGTVSEKVLYSFCAKRKCRDGQYPAGGLSAFQGILYGTTGSGGTGVKCGSKGCGTVFSLDPATRTETVLHSFCEKARCLDGVNPGAGVIAFNGTLYGTTASGGKSFPPDCCGTVFAVDPVTGAETVLHAFTGGPDGDFPVIGLIGADGLLYGGTQSGGKTMGTLFAVPPDTGVETVLYNWCTQSNCADGFNPFGIIDVNGTLYGTTLQGGAYNCDQGQGCGTLYTFDLKTGTHTVLYSFGNGADGGHPYAPPIAVNGVLYGTTGVGGAFGHGTLFSFDLGTGVETILHSFNGTDGASPVDSLTNVNGVLYGITASGGAMGGGTVFSYDLTGNTEATVYSFGGANDGSRPSGGLLAVGNKLYGTTNEGGKHGDGTVFVLNLK